MTVHSLTDGRTIFYIYKEENQQSIFRDSKIKENCQEGLPQEAVINDQKVTTIIPPGSYEFHKLFLQYAKTHHPELYWHIKESSTKAW